MSAEEIPIVKPEDIESMNSDPDKHEKWVRLRESIGRGLISEAYYQQ